MHDKRLRKTGTTDPRQSQPSKRVRVVGGTTWVWCVRHPPADEDDPPGAWLLPDAFATRTDRPTAYRSWCRVCEAELSAKRRDARKGEPRDEVNARRRELYRERQDGVREPREKRDRYQEELCEMVVCADDWLSSRGLARPERAAAIAVTEEAYASVVHDALAGTLTKNPLSDRFMLVPLIASDLPRAKKQANGAKWVPVLRARLARLELEAA